jgi:hypothetical protein
MRITPTAEQIKYVEEYLAKGTIAKRDYLNGTPFDEYVGILTKVIFCDDFKIPRIKRGCLAKENDLVFNNLKYKIKCAIRSNKVILNPKLKHRFIPPQLKYDFDVIVFYNYYPKTKQKPEELELCGYIKKEDFLKRKVFLPKGAL